jgi:hypothetical protein
VKRPRLVKSPGRVVSWLERTQYATAVIVMLCAAASLIWFNAAAAPGLFCLGLVLWVQPGFRRSAMRSGWLLGRSALLQSMHEAQRRGLSPEEWQIAEFERDVAVMRGAPIHLPRSEPEEPEPDGE